MQRPYKTGADGARGAVNLTPRRRGGVRLRLECYG